uniref:Uncharacterized protein n=1 Tax=Fagus sylvatica TaxID=28930 RepID=A0A2N9ELS8_FAGSY
MMNLQNEQEISNERQEKNEQAADCESTAKTYLRSILDNDDQPIINTSKDFLRCPKVPPMLRNIERSKDYYDPKFISFGPYHHEKDELQATQKIKTKVMQNFILEHGKEIEDLYNQVRLLNDYSRRCYVDGSTDAYGDEAFALMMLQDGCFILFLIELRIYTFRKNNEWRTSRNEEISSMIKNHLGHSELVLMCNMYKENEGLTMIKSFLYRIHWGEFPKEVTRDENEMEPDHLLGLLKTLISKCGDHVETVLEKADSAMDVICYLQSFSSVSDLKEIDFKPSNSISLHSALLKEKPKSTSLRDVDFRSSFFSGELKLPPLFVGDQSQLYYTNLIAFEACAPIDCTVTSYINFMNLLIANPKDVKALRSKRIIPTLHSDEDVFTMFKEISATATATATNLLDDITMYQGVREKIEEHCNNKIKIWIGEMRHKYFSQPWPVISLLVAVVVIILTFLQTFYTIKPRKA